MRLADLQPASFRGARFLVPNDTLEEGRTALDHLYPDANYRYAEDNGGIPPKFKISAIVCEPGLPGKLNALRRALTAQGPGTLRHPWCGTQFVQVDGTYSIKRDDKHAGYVELEIKFLVTGPPQLPGIASGVPAVVSGLASSTLIDLFAEFVREYGAPLSIGVAGRAVPEVSGLIDSLSSFSRGVLAQSLIDIGETLVASFASASSAPGRIVAESGSLSGDPRTLADLLIVAMRSPFATETISDAALIRGYRLLGEAASAVHDDADTILPTTLDLANRKTAMTILASYIQAAAFVNLAEAVAVKAYVTADDVERSEKLLTDHYETLYNRDLSALVRTALGTIFVAASEVLRDAVVRLPRIVSVPASNTPASVLAYMLYENRFEAGNAALVETRASLLVNLNMEQTPLLLAGNINALMQDA